MRGDRVGERRVRRGFSLIEAVFLIILLGAATAAMVTVFGAIGSSQSDVDVRQRGVLLAEACAELIFSSRSLLNNTVEGISPECAVLNNSSYYAPYAASVSVSRLGVTSPMPYPSLCYQPNNDPALDPACVQVEITVSGGGATLPPIFLQLSER